MCTGRFASGALASFEAGRAAAGRRNALRIELNGDEGSPSFQEFGFAIDDPRIRLYDVLLAETDPDLVFFEMDIFWAYVAQYRFSRRPDGTPAPFEPLDYVLEAPARYPLFHVKDGAHDAASRDGYRMVDVGDGDIDYRHFLSAVERRHGRRRADWIVERDDAVDPAANPAGSLSTARRSACHLRGLRAARD
ncbi:hypothetical protein [Streptomyces sp. NPDC017529]|uniref:hypothetical protein n=1 Tax=Streptomyces sp. NPDC017529 TaxID=3365000 RepID=UPI0037AB9CB6